MAEGRNIEIKIAAVDQASPVLAGLNKNVDNLSGGGSGKGFQALNAETQKVTAAGVKMGTGMQNVGYQVQDLAVQIGSGTSAFRAMGQQLPQLLSGFGPVGIALGTISAVALPLAGALFNMAGAVDEVSTASEKAAEETVDLARAQENSLVIERESADRKRELAETLRVVTREQYSYNDSIQRTLDLLKETQGIENEIAAAKGQLAIDKAGDDPVKKAQVTNDVRKEAQARELQQIEARNKVITDLIDRKGAQEVSVGNAGEAAAKNLRDQAGAAGAEALEKEQLEKTRNAFADDKEDFAKNAPKGKFRKEAELAAEQAREDARKAADEAKQARAKEKDLNSAAGGVESGSAAEVKRLQGEAQKLFDELNKNKRDADTKRQLFGIRDEQGGLAEERVRKAAKEKQDRLAADEERKRQRKELEQRENNLDGSAAAAGGKFFNAGKNVGGSLGKTLGNIGGKLSDGTNEAEIAKLQAEFTAATQGMGGATIAAMKAMLAAQQAQAKEIEQLRQQIRNK